MLANVRIKGGSMISSQSLEILLDLIEIKLSSMIVQDKDDLRELRRLKNCKAELMSCCKEAQKNILAESSKPSGVSIRAL